MAKLPTIRLKPRHVQPIWAGHPWIYAQAVDRVEGGALPGDEVLVVDPRGNLLGRGFYSPRSAIVCRLLVRDESTPVDDAFFFSRIERAIALRERFGLPSADTNAYRLIHAEGDGLPGLIVDRFGDVLSVQLLTIGMKHRQESLYAALSKLLRPRTIFERTPARIAELEGFPVTEGVVRGEELKGFSFVESGLKFNIPVELGQKTGFYVDQRHVRTRVEAIARGRTVLDAYSFVAPMGMHAARGGAKKVMSVDENALALEVAAECARDNGLLSKMEFVRADARKLLPEIGQSGGMDLVILDPPRLAPSRAARDKALFAYTRLAEQGCRATAPNGDLVFCSCSAAIDLEALTRVLATGAQRANVQASVCERHFQGPDHPVPANFDEGLYLKVLFARVVPR